MANPASNADVVSRWRPLSWEEEIVSATLLGDAWSMLQQRVPTIVARLAASPIDVDLNLVKMTLANMVIRVLRNVDGKTQESIEDYSYTVNEAVAAGYLYISDGELDLLDPVGGSSAAFTIRPYGAADTTATDVWDVVP